MSRVLITGATGFVGRAVVPAVQAANFEAATAIRGPHAPAFGDSVLVHEVGDIGPDTNWKPVLMNVESVIHLAARAHVMDGVSEDSTGLYDRSNKMATLRLARQAAEHDVRRLVFASTVKVNGERTVNAPFNRRDEPSPVGPYAVSKAEAEEGLRRISEETGLEVVILRSPLVYGEGVKGNFHSLLRVCSSALPLPFGSVSNQRSMIYVGNLADAITQSLSHVRAANQTFMVRDGEDVSTADLVRYLRAAFGVPARVYRFPTQLLRLAARAARQGVRVSRLLDSLVVDDAEFRDLLGWTPPFSLHEGLDRTVAWYQSQLQL